MIILVTLRNNPAFQILLLLTISVFSQILIIKSKPYDTRLTNVVTFFNELAVSLFLYLSFLLSDFVQARSSDIEEIKVLEFRLLISWIMTMLLCIVVALNFFAYLFV
jgi:hypothetical protein